MKYLPHIDGLRALAVLSVFLYHLAPGLASGGYIGVDIFFVISGFLITRIIKDKAEDNNFSFSNFYIRRARRLLPAFVATVIFTFVVGYLILSPQKLTELANTGAWALAGVSNIYFYNNLGYFDLSSDSQLFLHTWSLAVEEQFYLIWPTMLLLILTLGKTAQKYALLTLAIMGMAASVWITKTNPDAAFYMMPARTGEFAFGAILNFFAFNSLKGIFARILADLSLIIVTAMLILLPATIEFPGLVVYLACLATSILIVIGDKGYLSAALLRHKASVKIGKISYSLYLVHWPLIIYSNELGYQVEGISIVIILVVGILLAILSERFIERPFRTPDGLWKTDLSVAASSGFVVIFTFFLLANTLAEKGYPGRLPESLRFIATSVDSEKERRFEILNIMCQQRGWKTCRTRSQDKRNVLILGDSQGVDGLNILTKFLPLNHYILDAVPGCPPMTIESFNKLIKEKSENYLQCRELTSRNAEETTYQDIDTVVISANFAQWYTPQELSNFLEQLRLHYVGNILIFGNPPNLTQVLPEIALSTTSADAAGRKTYAHLVQNQNYDQELKDIATAYNAIFESKSDYFCSEEKQVCDIYVEGTNFLFSYDERHLSIAATEKIATALKNKHQNWYYLFLSTQH